MFSEKVIWLYLKTFVEGYPPQIILNFFLADKSCAFSSTNLLGRISKKCWNYAPGMVLATCEMYLLDEFVKTSFETRPPKLCQTHIWQDTSITQNIRSNISLNKSDNTFRSKTISLTFCKIFWRKSKNTLGTYLPEIILRNLLGWLVSWLVPKNVPNISSDTIPQQSCWRYLPPIVLTEISLTPEYVHARRFLHQRTFSPEEALLQTVFTSGTFDTKGFLDQISFPPQAPHTKEFIYIYIYICVHQKTLTKKHNGYVYSRTLLHQRGFTP